MGRQWGRLYCNTRNHRKIIALRRLHPRRWLVFYPLLEMAFEAHDDGKIYVTPEIPYTIGDIADQVGVPWRKLVPVLESMCDLRLINFSFERSNDENLTKKMSLFLQFTSYSDRQFASDDVTERTRRFKEKQQVSHPRERSLERSQPVPGNAPETETETETEFNTPLNPPFTPPSQPSADVPPQGGVVENGSGKKRSRKKADRQLPPYSADFELLWTHYPNPTGGKEEAWSIWRRRQKKGTLPPINYLMENLRKLANDPEWMRDSGKFVPMITTFLNQGRWTDGDKLKSKPKMKPIDPDCPYCKGHGFEPVIKDGVEFTTPCRCRR